ncbi:MAG: hypothetical protein IJ461_04150 [Clostridia bacterium]|nr:hypothetical protein [Clostridia bacterium]
MILPVNFEIADSRKLVMIGEAGSGKTELAMNIAASIREMTQAPAVFLDMDQTKPLFRARDAAQALREKGVTFNVTQQFLDAPVVPHGVKSALADPELYVVMDVGGNKAGALCLGQYALELEKAQAQVFYTINPYRSFSQTSGHIAQTREMILSCCQLNDVRIVGNPYIGPQTTPQDYRAGAQKLEEMLHEINLSVYAWLVPQSLKDHLEPLPERCILIDPFMPGVLDIS